jgi:putative acetyltransferase
MNEIRIRHSGNGDIEQIRQIYAEPDNYAATLQLPYPSENLWEKRLRDLPDGSYSLIACRAEKVLGHLGMDVHKSPRRKHVATLGLAVGTGARRQGVGSALLGTAVEMAERWLAVRRIELDVYTDNLAAIALYEKFGFAVEGTLRQFAFRNGEFVDVHVMARIAA